MWIFGHLNINSISEQIKGSIYIFMIIETKLDGSFPRGQLFSDDYNSHFDLILIKAEAEYCFMSRMLFQQKS